MNAISSSSSSTGVSLDIATEKAQEYCWSYENAGLEQDPTLSFLDQEITTFLERDIWLRICPFLTIANEAEESQVKARNDMLSLARDLFLNESSMKNSENLGDLLDSQGYFGLGSADTTFPLGICEKLAMGIRRLSIHGYSAMFILQYDEAWIVGDLLNTIITAASGNAPIGDWLILCVGDNGSVYKPGPPHRDRPTADQKSFRAEKQRNNNSSTTAVAATATPTSDVDLAVLVADLAIVSVVSDTASDASAAALLVVAPSQGHMLRPVTKVSQNSNNNSTQAPEFTAGTLVAAATTTSISTSITGTTGTTTELGSPKYCSVWLALTDATPESSCLYVIPRKNDPGYEIGGDAISGLGHHWNDIVAQPLPQGGFLTFSHRLLHWGSTPQAGRVGRGRIALTLAYADPSFEKEYYDHSLYTPFPPMGLRLGIIAGQSIQYEHLAPLNKQMLPLFRRIFHQQKQYFATEYFEKISSASQFLTFQMKQQKGNSLRR